MRILFISSNRIGDAVLTTGVLSWLVDRYPRARLTVACGPMPAPLFCAVPGLERMIVLGKKRFHGHWASLWASCAGTRWDLIVDLRNTLVSRLLLARKRAHKPARASGRHKVEDLASALSIFPPPSPRLWLDDPAREAAQRLLGAEGGAPILALGPTANWPPKQWPVRNFIALARTLTAGEGPLKDARVLVLAAPHEREQADPLLKALGARAVDGVGLDLPAAAACLARARLFVGNDSGLMHMAAAAGTPTLGLFGPGYEAIYGPWGKRTATVRTPESAGELFSRLPYPGAFAPLLMDSLDVGTVLTAANALLAKS